MPSALQYNFTDNLSTGLKNIFEKAGISSLKTDYADKKAKIKCGLQFINFIINGSSKEPVTPPVKWGNLRAAGSVHVGTEFVGGNNLYPVKSTGGLSEINEKAESNTANISENVDTITIGFNTSYATRMHETNWNPGKTSEQAGNTGNKYIQKHLYADKDTILEFYAITFKKELANLVKSDAV
jgi:hypothetical protein